VVRNDVERLAKTHQFVILRCATAHRGTASLLTHPIKSTHLKQSVHHDCFVATARRNNSPLRRNHFELLTQKSRNRRWLVMKPTTPHRRMT
jgi:hypothetical protein